MRILIATWDCAGGFPPQRALIRGLAARGHEVHVAAHDSLQGRIETAGATFQHLPKIAQYDSCKPITPEAERALIFDGLIFSEEFGRDLHAAVSRLAPDAVLIDMALLTAFVAARAAGAPVGMLTTTIFKFVEWFGSQYLQRRAALEAFGARLGYALPATWLDMIGAAPVIASTYRPFEPETNFPPGYLCAGPLREPVTGPPFKRMLPGKPLVLVSLSTSFMHQSALLSTLCRAVGQLDLEAIVTTGDAIDPEALEPAPNTQVVRFVPHDAILPAARLVVTHAGHGTVMAALSHGAPLLLLPMGRDQPVVAARAAELGLGVVMDSRSSAVELASAIERELADPLKQACCRAFRDKLCGHPGLDDAVLTVERLASSKRN